MLHSYQSPETPSGRNPLARRPIVLARLPYVGAEVPKAEQRQALPQPSPTVSTLPVSEPHYSSVETPQPEVLDSQPAAPIAQFPEFPSPPHEQASTPPAMLRHDTGHTRHQTPPVGLPGDSSPGTMIHMQQRVASHSGLIVTLALLAFAALLYLTLVVPAGQPMADYQNSFEFYSSTPKETADNASKSQNAKQSEAVSVASLPLDPFAIELEETEAAAAVTKTEVVASEDLQVTLPTSQETATEKDPQRSIGLSPESGADLLQLPSLVTPTGDESLEGPGLKNEPLQVYPSTSTPSSIDYSKLYELMTPEDSSVHEVQTPFYPSTGR